MSCHDANFVRAGRIESRVLTDGDPGKRQRWNPRTGERTRLAAAGAVAGADRTWLATPRAQTVRLTNLKDGSVLDIGLKDGAGPQGARNAGTVTVSGDGKLLASITDDEVQFRRMADAQLLTTVPLLGNADIGGEQPQGAFERRTFRYLIEDRVFSIDLSDLSISPANSSINFGRLGPGGQVSLIQTGDRTQLRDVRDGKAVGLLAIFVGTVRQGDRRVQPWTGRPGTTSTTLTTPSWRGDCRSSRTSFGWLWTLARLVG